jgi:lysozyme
MRQINAAGLALIKTFEGCRLTAYLCPAGVWTIGYGSTGRHVHHGMRITPDQAEDLLKIDLERFEAAVDAATHAVPTTDNQFSAMVSMAFNCGEKAYLRSSIRRWHCAGKPKLAAAAFLLWVKAGGRKLGGLVRRRAAESRLYLSPDN